MNHQILENLIRQTLAEDLLLQNKPSDWVNLISKKIAIKIMEAELKTEGPVNTNTKQLLNG